MCSSDLKINAAVAAVEERDPFVYARWGVAGLGEGLVYYPTSIPHRRAMSNLMFKAKGEKHRTAGTRTAAAVDAAVVASVDDFVALMVTEARLAQGLAAVSEQGARDPKLTGKFLEWIVADVRKESAAELAASGLTFAQVEKAIRARARAWFLSDSAS